MPRNRRDLVTYNVAQAVLRRDGNCVAVKLGANDRCRGRLHLDHVKDQPHVGDPVVKRLTRSRKAPSDEQHLVAICEHHHLDGWATSHRTELRDYLVQNRD